MSDLTGHGDSFSFPGLPVTVRLQFRLGLSGSAGMEELDTGDRVLEELCAKKHIHLDTKHHLQADSQQILQHGFPRALPFAAGHELPTQGVFRSAVV